MPSVNIKHDIKVLNSLIETTLDSADGYRAAAEETKDANHKSLFQRWATDRRSVVTALQGEVRTLGGKPDEDGSILAAGHRVFVKLRDSISKGDDSVVDEVERGEDVIKAKFEKAMKDDELSVGAREAVVKAYASVKTGHDQARDLKRAVHAKH